VHLGCCKVILGSFLEGCCRAWGLLLGALSYVEGLEFFNKKSSLVPLGCCKVILGSFLEGCCRAWGRLLGALSYVEGLEIFNKKKQKDAKILKKCNKPQKCCCGIGPVRFSEKMML
jgi:hypothetical protein